MREIKFRAKSIEDGKWVYGVPVTTAFDAPIMIPSMGQEPTAEFVWTSYSVVDGNTLGQYTGLKDKNGKEIYEGDIVKGYEIHCTPDCVATDPEPLILHHYYIAEAMYRITFDGDSAMFNMINIENNVSEKAMFFFEDYCEKWEELGCPEDDIENKDAYPSVKPKDINSYEVIGNIYDNPELFNK